MAEQRQDRKQQQGATAAKGCQDGQSSHFVAQARYAPIRAVPGIASHLADLVQFEAGFVDAADIQRKHVTLPKEQTSA